MRLFLQNIHSLDHYLLTKRGKENSFMELLWKYGNAVTAGLCHLSSHLHVTLFPFRDTDSCSSFAWPCLVYRSYEPLLQTLHCKRAQRRICKGKTCTSTYCLFSFSLLMSSESRCFGGGLSGICLLINPLSFHFEYT